MKFLYKVFLIVITCIACSFPVVEKEKEYNVGCIEQSSCPIEIHKLLESCDRIECRFDSFEVGTRAVTYYNDDSGRLTIVYTISGNPLCQIKKECK